MRLKVTSTASSKKGNIFVSTQKLSGETPKADDVLYCVTEEEYLKLKGLSEPVQNPEAKVL